MNDIFLSAGVPEPDDPEFGLSSDPLLIHSAIRSLCALAFGTYRIVWGGHPAITPMMWAACENLSADYAASVHLYQSKFFKQDFPEENEKFANVTFAPKARTEEASLRRMRETMIASHPFVAGIFIGGKNGVISEFALFRERHAKASVAILTTTGGAARRLGLQFPALSSPPGNFIDFTTFLSERIPPVRPGPGRALREG